MEYVMHNNNIAQNQKQLNSPSASNKPGDKSLVASKNNSKEKLENTEIHNKLHIPSVTDQNRSIGENLNDPYSNL